ncbi:MAG TPA: hypothetical protein VEA60_07145 [Allosphingosinicella sp.]|nr:hypothetical protein [Allosphingosinicella sp.]
MDQARDRDQDPAICWRFARAEAEQAASTGSPSYWLEPSVPPSCHPFGRSARIRLAHLSDEKFLPWRTGFEPNYGGAEDRWSLSEALRVDLEARTFRRNGVLAFVVSYENRRQDLIAAPPELGPAFQTLIVQIRRPDGDVYQHRPRALNCSTGLEPLRPGGRLQWPFCTMRGPGGFALGQVGVYELVVIAPRLGAASAPVQFEVVEPSQAGPKAPPVPRALAGTPASARSEARLRREIASRLGRRDIDPLTRGYLALTQIGFETDPAKIVKLESQALAPTSPTEVRHAAALARFKRLAAAGRLGRRARNDLCRRHLQRPEDQALSTRLCEEPL